VHGFTTPTKLTCLVLWLIHLVNHTVLIDACYNRRQDILYMVFTRKHKWLDEVTLAVIDRMVAYMVDLQVHNTHNHGCKTVMPTYTMVCKR
jgi:hypothetical protein